MRKQPSPHFQVYNLQWYWLRSYFWMLSWTKFGWLILMFHSNVNERNSTGTHYVPSTRAGDAPGGNQAASSRYILGQISEVSQCLMGLCSGIWFKRRSVDKCHPSDWWKLFWKGLLCLLVPFTLCQYLLCQWTQKRSCCLHLTPLMVLISRISFPQSSTSMQTTFPPLFAESQNYLGCKRPLRSPSSACGQSPPCHPAQSTECSRPSLDTSRDGDSKLPWAHIIYFS